MTGRLAAHSIRNNVLLFGVIVFPYIGYTQALVDDSQVPANDTIVLSPNEGTNGGSDTTALQLDFKRLVTDRTRPRGLPHITKLGPEPKPKTRGSIELGSTYGQLPFTLPTNGPVNAFAKGNVALSAGKVPLGIAFDLGTDQPVRGQRNSIRFQFDAPRQLSQERWEQAHALHLAQKELDSLNAVSSHNRRKLNGTLAKAKAHQAGWGEQVSMEPGLNRPVQVDTIAHEKLDPLTHDPRDPKLTSQVSGADSLNQAVRTLQAEQAELDSTVAEQERKVQRAKAVVSATGEKRGRLTQLAQGIRKLELGSCYPSSSEFLLNGINFQGLSFEFAHKDLYIAADHGRSFDDTWQNNDQVGSGLRRLQQSLFMIDVQDLNPRRFTVIRTGFGTPEGTHAHVGYLFGKRNDLPMGLSTVGTPPLQLLNHVVELDVGYIILQNHQIRLQYARSLTIGGLQLTDGSNSEAAGIGDLFDTREKEHEAIHVAWLSSIEKTGTRIEVDVRSIDRYFQSFGLGFIRNGSRSVELRSEQRLGSKLRVRTRYTKEERDLPSSEPGAEAQLDRASLGFIWQPTRAWRLTATTAPAWIRRNGQGGSDGVDQNQVHSIGASWRKRVRKVTFSTDVQTGLYIWRAVAVQQGARTASGSFTVEKAERWLIRASYSCFSNTAVDTLPRVQNIGFVLRAKLTSSISVAATSNVSDRELVGWSFLVRWQIGSRSFIQLENARLEQFDNYLSTIDTSYSDPIYNWKLSYQYTW